MRVAGSAGSPSAKPADVHAESLRDRRRDRAAGRAGVTEREQPRPSMIRAAPQAIAPSTSRRAAHTTRPLTGLTNSLIGAQHPVRPAGWIALARNDSSVAGDARLDIRIGFAERSSVTCGLDAASAASWLPAGLGCRTHEQDAACGDRAGYAATTRSCLASPNGLLRIERPLYTAVAADEARRIAKVDQARPRQDSVGIAPLTDSREKTR